MALLEFKRTIDIGNILTVATIFLSVLGLLHTLNKDYDLQVRDQANQVRVSASDIIQRIDRLSSLPLLSSTKLQSSFVETSEFIEKDGQWLPLEARDFLWKRISDERERVEEEIYSGNLNVLVGHYFAYDPKVRGEYRNLVEKISTLRYQFFVSLSEETQRNIMDFAEKKQDYQTAEVGNKLRETAQAIKQKYRDKTQDAVQDLIGDLTSTIELEDEELMQRVGDGS